MLPCWVVACLGLLLGGCGADPYPGDPPGALHLGLDTAPESLDPAGAGDQYSNTCVTNLYDQLYEYDHYARPYAVKPCLALDMPEVSPDGLVYTIRIKPGVRYIDDPCFTATGGVGRELVAADLKFCILRMMDARTRSDGTWLFAERVRGIDAFVEASKSQTIPKDPHREAYTATEGYPEVDGIEVVDEHTIRFHLIEPYPMLTWVLAMGYASFYPPEAVAYYGNNLAVHAVGSGPYRLAHRPARLKHKLEFERNPWYRDDPYPENGTEDMRDHVGQPMPFSPRVVLTVMEEDQPMWLYFLRGHLDRAGIPKDNFSQAIDTESGELLPSLAEQGIRLEKDSRLDIVYDAFNMESPVIGTPAGEKGRALRRAISLAMDNDWAIRHLYNGRAEEVQGPILREFREFDPSFRNPWKQQPGETRAQVLERARKVLADAGMPGGQGAPTLVKDIQTDTTGLQFFQSFKADMAAIGLNVESLQVQFPDMLRRIRNKEAQMWGAAWGADYPAAENFLQLFYGPNQSPGANGSNFDDPEFNRLYEEARSLPPSSARDEIYRAMERIVARECPWNFRLRRLNFNLSQPWLHGYRYNDLSTKYFKYCRVDDAKRRAALATRGTPSYGPALLAGGVLLLLVIVTMIAARRTRRGW